METTRVSRRELDLLARYALVHAGLDVGWVNAGGRLLVAAEEWYGGAVAWMAANLDRLVGADPSSVVPRRDADAGWHLQADRESVVTAGIAALDLATADARRTGAGSARVTCWGTSLAPALTVLAAARGLVSLVSVPDGAGEGRPSVAAGGPARPFVWLAEPPLRDVAGEFRIAVAAPTGQLLAPVPFPDSAREGVEVPFDAWVRLLDRVGGTLPPDGRGHLTPTDPEKEHEAGPGAGRLHDDD